MNPSMRKRFMISILDCIFISRSLYKKYHYLFSKKNTDLNIKKSLNPHKKKTFWRYWSPIIMVNKNESNVKPRNELIMQDISLSPKLLIFYGPSSLAPSMRT